MAKRLTLENFIERSKQVHGDKYSYEYVDISNGAHGKVKIVCPIHGVFEQAPSQHMVGNGCRKCAIDKKAIRSRKSPEKFLEECRAVWGNRYDLSKTVYTGIYEQITVICKEHGEFTIRANDFVNGHGCQECGGTKRLTTSTFIEKAFAKHGNLYDYSKVDYKNNREKVCIICPIHGEFWQTPSQHLNGDKCPYCFRNFKKTNEEFIAEARKVHGNKYDYSKVDYKGNKKYITIICPEHGEFRQKPLSHLQGQGCQKCYDVRRGLTLRIDKDLVFERFKEKHGERYDYSKVVFEMASDVVEIICPEHGSFFQRCDKHMKGHGCPKCASIKNGFNKRVKTKEFIERANAVHHNFYTYEKTDTLYDRRDGKVCITCPIHGDFWQDITVHLSGCGCPSCNESRLEKEVRYFLDENNIKYVYQANKKDLPYLERQTLDFYLPDYNVGIECQGLQHFTPCSFTNDTDEKKLNEEFSTIIRRDKNKFNKCCSNNLRLIYYFKDIRDVKKSKSAEKFYYSKEIINELDDLKNIIFN